MKWTALMVLAVLAAQPALAQAPPQRFVGTVQSLRGETLTVKTTEGKDIDIVVPENLPVTALANRTLADIRPGDFVGSAAKLGRDGHLHAQEVHIFPEAMRGRGEGHRPMAGVDQTMTNATVAGLAAAPDGTILTLRYPSGEQAIEVGPEARIVTFIPGDQSLLKPGATVAIFATQLVDGHLTASSIQAEKDGVKPLVF